MKLRGVGAHARVRTTGRSLVTSTAATALHYPMTGRPPRQTKRSRSRSGRKAVSVSIIGAGRLGTALAIALNRAGHSIALIVARHAASARRANKLSGGQAK